MKTTNFFKKTGKISFIRRMIRSSKMNKKTWRGFQFHRDSTTFVCRRLNGIWNRRAYHLLRTSTRTQLSRRWKICSTSSKTQTANLSSNQWWTKWRFRCIVIRRRAAVIHRLTIQCPWTLWNILTLLGAIPALNFTQQQTINRPELMPSITTLQAARIPHQSVHFSTQFRAESLCASHRATICTRMLTQTVPPMQWNLSSNHCLFISLSLSLSQNFSFSSKIFAGFTDFLHHLRIFIFLKF